MNAPSSTLSLTAETLTSRFHQPFRISRPEDTSVATTVVVELHDSRHPDLVGLGEGFPVRYYGETPATMAAAFPTLLEAVGEPELTAEGLARAGEAMAVALRWNGAAKCAIDTALHDLAGKAQGRPVYELLGLGSLVPPTDYTLGIDDPELVAARARDVAHFPALKLKVGGPSDLETLRAVRRVFAGPLRVDANTGWEPAIASAMLADLAELGVEVIEQPFPARRYDWLRDLQAESPIPIVADESAVTLEDLDALVGVVAGVNVKLGKCGGIGPARRMLETATAMGFKTFLGCMEETSLGIAASATIASLADWVDLDGNLLLADDPYQGLALDADCRWVLSREPGLGVKRRAVAETLSTRPDRYHR